MKLYTTPEQTAKLIALGFEKPKGWCAEGICSHLQIFMRRENDEGFNYSIGELIEMLPTSINWTPRVILQNSIEYSFGTGDSELFIFNLYDELIDNLFDAVVKLKEEGLI